MKQFSIDWYKVHHNKTLYGLNTTIFKAPKATISFK